MYPGSLGLAASGGLTLPALASSPTILDPLPPTVGDKGRQPAGVGESSRLCVPFSMPGTPASSHSHSTCRSSSPPRPSTGVTQAE